MQITSLTRSKKRKVLSQNEEVTCTPIAEPDVAVSTTNDHVSNSLNVSYALSLRDIYFPLFCRLQEITFVHPPLGVQKTKVVSKCKDKPATAKKPAIDDDEVADPAHKGLQIDGGVRGMRSSMRSSKRPAAIAAAANIRQSSTEDESVDYYARPELLYDSRLYIWLPYFEEEEGKREYVDGEYYYARVDGYENKKWKVTFEHDGSCNYLTLSSVLGALK